MTFRCQLYVIHGFGDFGCNYNKVLQKTIKNIQISKKIEKTLNDVITAVLFVFKYGTLTSFFLEFSFDLHILIFNLLLCMGLQTSILALYLLSNTAAENNWKPLKTTFEKIEKQNVEFFGFGFADDEYYCI